MGTPPLPEQAGVVSSAGARLLQSSRLPVTQPERVRAEVLAALRSFDQQLPTMVAEARANYAKANYAPRAPLYVRVVLDIHSSRSMRGKWSDASVAVSGWEISDALSENYSVGTEENGPGWLPGLYNSRTTRLDFAVPIPADM